MKSCRKKALTGRGMEGGKRGLERKKENSTINMGRKTKNLWNALTQRKFRGKTSQ